MITWDDLLWLMDVGILTLETYYDSEHEQPYLHVQMWSSDSLNAALEQHKMELYLRARKLDGAVL